MLAIRVDRHSWQDLVSQLKRIEFERVTSVARDYLEPREGQISLEPTDMWLMLGGREGLRRMRENASIVTLVRAKLTQRAGSYRFALERMVIMTPSPQAVEVERAINQMQALIARYRSPAPPWVREQNLVTVR